MSPAEQARRIAADADRLSRAFSRELADVWGVVGRRLLPLVRRAGAGSTTALIRAAQAQQARDALRHLLRESGYDALADAATRDPLEGVLRLVLRDRLAQQSAELVALFPAKIEALKMLPYLDLLDEGDAVTRQLWKALVRGVFNAQEPERIVEDLVAILDDTEAHIATLYDTAVSIFGRQIEALVANPSPDTRFLYTGPDDAVTRPFCRTHLGARLTRAEIDALDNGQLDNVFLTGGGYNCRHLWMEVSSL